MKLIQISSQILKIESLAVFSLGLYMVALGFTHDKAWMPFLSVIGFSFVGSAALFFLSKGIKESKRWATSPAVLANLIALGVAKYQFEAGVYWLAIPISALAITVLVTLLLSFRKSNP